MLLLAAKNPSPPIQYVQNSRLNNVRMYAGVLLQYFSLVELHLKAAREFITFIQTAFTT